MSMFKNYLKKLKAPWSKFYKKKEMEIEVEDISIYQMFKNRAIKYKDLTAINYFGRTLTYEEFLRQIDMAAQAFRSQGIRKGDVVTICMPNTPEGVISFYALNKIGALANMIHPLSGEKEIKDYLNSTNSVMLVMIDICYEKIENIIKDTNVYKTIVVSAKDSMPFIMGVGYEIFQGMKIKKPKSSETYLYWKDFMKKALSYEGEYIVSSGKDNAAVILHSGGTTGTPKGIVLSNGNFNALAQQAGIVFKTIKPKDRILAIMPIFHGFGLGVSVHAPFYLGMEVVLVPQFDAKKFDKLIEKNNPQAILGVPTLFEALINTKNDNLDLSRVKVVISGGDTLSTKLNTDINEYLKNHGSEVKISQGFGMTESLAATALAFGDANKDGSIGIPFPGNYFKMVAPGTQEEVKPLEDGEICVSGPTVMIGYLNNEKETNEMLQIHKDGHLWLHTGDIGYMDKDGVIFYRQRLKRMIITSGYNVYPSHVEEVIEEHPAVLKCSVVGMPHKYKVEVAKAYIVLKDGYTPRVKKSIIEYCKKNLAAYSIPYKFEFRKSLPKTLIGKVDIKALQEEAKGVKDNEEK